MTENGSAISIVDDALVNKGVAWRVRRATETYPTEAESAWMKAAGMRWNQDVKVWEARVPAVHYGYWRQWAKTLPGFHGMDMYPAILTGVVSKNLLTSRPIPPPVRTKMRQPFESRLLRRLDGKEA